MYLISQVRDFVDYADRSDATCITLWLVNNDCKEDMNDERVWPYFHSAEQFKKAILEVLRREEALAVRADPNNEKRFCNKNLWLLTWMHDSPSPRRKSKLQNSSPSPEQSSSLTDETTKSNTKPQEAVQAPATSLLKAVSEKQRPTCPVCNNTGILSKCDECDERIHAACVRNHSTSCKGQVEKKRNARNPDEPRVAPEAALPKTSAQTKPITGSQRNLQPPASPAAPAVPDVPIDRPTIYRLAAPVDSVYAPGVGTNKRPFERAQDQNTTASLDDENIPTVDKFRDENLRKDWVELGHSKLEHFSNAPRSQQQAMIWEFMNLVKYHGRKPQFRGANSNTRERFTKAQLKGVVMVSRISEAEKTAEELRDFQKALDENDAEEEREYRKALEDDRARRKAYQKLTNGHRGKAARIMMQDRCEPTDPKIAAGQLRDLHPQEPESPNLRIETKVKLHELDPDVLEKIVRKMCHGSSAGRTGWTEELLLPLVSSPKTRKQLAEIFLMIINNEVDPEIRQRINAARLIGIPKPVKHAAEIAGIRPITVNECFRKIAQAIAVQSVSSSAAKYFAGLQFGISVEGGCEILCHRIAAGMKKKNILVALDAKNAFNTPWRSKIAEALKSRPEFHSLINQWNFCYSEHTELHFRQGDFSEIILSQRGTRQGDVLGAFLFALVIHPTIKAAHERFGNEIEIMAYLDDITLIGDNAAAMKECVSMIQSSFENLGIEFNKTKCEWWTANETPCPFPGWRIHDKDSTLKILGALHSRDDEHAADELLKQTKAKHNVFFERLMKMNVNPALVILTASGIPRMNFAARVHKPEVSAAACKSFDSQVVSTFETLACTKLDESGKKLISLPVKMGGFSLTSFSDIRKLAYAASSDLASANPKKISQEQLVDARNMEVLAELKESSVHMALHIQDVQGDGNGHWVTSLEDVEPMSDDITSAAMRTRGNCVHEGVMGEAPSTECRCNRTIPRAEVNQHFSGCGAVGGCCAPTRHAATKNGTGRMCTANGIHHRHKEPEGYEMKRCTHCRVNFPASKLEAHLAGTNGCSSDMIKDASSVRPDKWIELKAEKGPGMVEVVVDFSIVAATTATNINRGQSVADGLKERERRKHALYGEPAKERGELLLAACVTPNGTMSGDCKRLVKMIAKTSDVAGYNERKASIQFKRCVLIANAASLINAEKKKGGYYGPKSKQMVAELLKRDVPQVVADVDAKIWYDDLDDIDPPDPPNTGSVSDREERDPIDMFFSPLSALPTHPTLSSHSPVSLGGNGPTVADLQKSQPIRSARAGFGVSNVDQIPLLGPVPQRKC
jgi:hypothetical protein